jgi:alpha-glucosidase
VAGEAGEYVVLERRKGRTWFLGGITNGTPRQLNLPLDFLAASEYDAVLYVDGSSDPGRPNDVQRTRRRVSGTAPLTISMSTGGGFVGVLTRSSD